MSSLRFTACHFVYKSLLLLNVFRNKINKLYVFQIIQKYEYNGISIIQTIKNKNPLNDSNTIWTNERSFTLGYLQ